MLLTRWFKHHHYMKNNVSKYLGYAAGEIVLVIAGILIALQIDAWYENEKVTQELDSQLRAVADSISQDVTNITRPKQQRTDSIFGSNRLADITGPPQFADVWYNRQYVEFASSLLAASQVPAYMVASTGTYQVVKSSGYENHISDVSLKRNLNDYYATIERIVFTEREMNNFVNEVTLRYQTDATQGFFKPFLQEPLLAWEQQNLDDEPDFVSNFRESYRRLLSDSVTQALIRSGRNQMLLKEYEHLLSLGSILVSQINAYIDREQYTNSGYEVFRADSRIGPATVLHQGRFEAHSMGMFTAPTNTALNRNVDALRMEQDHLRVTYQGGDDWAFIYVMVGPIEISVQKPSLDYSRFDRIRLELKRHSGCEDLRLVLKDSEDADDGTQANISLDLSDQWATYEYNLSLFSDADLRQLSVVSGFLMDSNACSFSVRDVAFLMPDDDKAGQPGLLSRTYAP